MSYRLAVTYTISVTTGLAGIVVAAPPQPDDPYTARGLHWCATGPENDARIAAAETRAAQLRAASGKNLTTAAAQIDQRYGLLIIDDVDDETLLGNQPFDLSGQSLRFVPADPTSYNATRETIQFDENIGDLAMTWTNVWGELEIILPFPFPFGGVNFTNIFVTSDLGIFFASQTQDGSSDQYTAVNFASTAPKITPLQRRGPWIWASIMDLHIRTDLDAITLTWRQRTNRPNSIHGIEQRVQAVLTAQGDILFSYPDADSRNTFGLVQVFPPGGTIPPAPNDFSSLSESPTLLTGKLGESFTFPELLPHTARDIIQNRYPTLTANVDLFAFYQTFYTDIVFYAGGYHSGNVLHINEINLSWNSRDETGNSVMLHEFGHDWLYFGMPDGSGAHPQMASNVPAAFPYQTPYDSSAMGGSFWLDNADGTFTSLPYRTYYGFSWHELYLMGLATRAEVEDWWYITDQPALTGPYYPPQSSTFDGVRTALDVNILDVADPEYPNTQTEFEILITLITRPAEPLRESDLANMRRKLDQFASAWSASTGGRSTVRVRFAELDPNGDHDFDGDVDMRDFAIFQSRYSGENIPVPAGPDRASDFDADTDVDLFDFDAWQSLAGSLCVEPTFIVQPQHKFVCEGSTVSLHAVARDADWVQWRRSGIDLPGENGPNLTLSGVTADDAGTYSVFADNDCGSTLSATANVIVVDGPQIVLYPNQVSMCAGQPAAFTPNVEGVGPFSYEWTHDGEPIPAATQNTYQIPAAASADEGVYTVIVSDLCGVKESNLLIATINAQCADK